MFFSLSPALATDAPIDLKIKSNCLADFLNLMGIEGTWSIERMTHGYDSYYHTILKATNPFQVGKTKCTKKLISSDLLNWTKDQNSRRGGFIRIFPTKDTRKKYSQLFPTESQLDEYIALNLFGADSSRNSVKGKMENIDLYERMLPDVFSDERRQLRRRMRRKNIKKRNEITSDLDDDAEE